MGLMTRLKHSWNAFKSEDPGITYNIGPADYSRPDRTRLSYGNERTIIASIYNKLALDVCTFSIVHVRLDESKRYKEDMTSYLNYCLTESANIDQTSKALLQQQVKDYLLILFPFLF